MSYKGKRKDEGHASDGGDSDDHAPPHKKSSKFETDDSGEIVVCELSKSRKVKVRSWNGKVVVDIREFYVKDGKELPGKKGISLPMDQWRKLMAHMDEIDKAMAEES